jgi:hypothetical protein
MVFLFYRPRSRPAFYARERKQAPAATSIILPGMAVVDNILRHQAGPRSEIKGERCAQPLRILR